MMLKRQLKIGERLLELRDEYREVNYLVPWSIKLSGHSAAKGESGSGCDRPAHIDAQHMTW
jgi:hypothetical protein